MSLNRAMCDAPESLSRMNKVAEDEKEWPRATMTRVNIVDLM